MPQLLNDFFAAPIRADWSRVGGGYTLTYYRAWRGRRCTFSIRSFSNCGMDCTWPVQHGGSLKSTCPDQAWCVRKLHHDTSSIHIKDRMIEHNLISVHLPTTLFSGADGTMRPLDWCVATSFEWRPKKSLNLRITVCSDFLNDGSDVCTNIKRLYLLCYTCALTHQQ